VSLLQSVDSAFVNIEKYLPHGEAFRFIDTAKLHGSSRIECTYLFQANQPYQLAHFPPPGKPIMAGTCLLEGLMQAGSLLYVVLESPGGKLTIVAKGVRALSAKLVTWNWPVTKGKEVNYDVEITRKAGRVWYFHGIARVNHHIACEAFFSGAMGK
jgi:3-hydroxymyristoyl/3-hydroxydecanoyl-(acyl carrier protein) dehydratase